jgi:hypothetical protein
VLRGLYRRVRAKAPVPTKKSYAVPGARRRVPSSEKRQQAREAWRSVLFCDWTRRANVSRDRSSDTRFQQTEKRLHVVSPRGRTL